MQPRSSDAAKRQESHPDHWDQVEAALTWARRQARHDLNAKELVEAALRSRGDLVPCSNGIHYCRRDQLVQWLGPKARRPVVPRLHALHDPERTRPPGRAAESEVVDHV